MDNDKFNDVSKAANGMVRVVEALWNVLERIVPGIRIGRAITEGHAQVIDSYVKRTDIDEISKMFMLANYRKRIKEIKRCSKVVELAEEMLDKNSKADAVDDDWFDFFFDRVKNVSDERAQNMWAQVLAGEVNKPGTFSRALIHTLSIMSQSQARFFCNLSRFCMKEYRSKSETRRVHAFVFLSTNPDSYSHSNITYEQLRDMENLGLIRCNFDSEYVFKNKQYLSYGNKIIEICGNEKNDYKIKVGNVCLTNNGESLYTLVGDEYKAYSTQILNFTISALEDRGCHVYVNEQLKTRNNPN